jgi:isopropylmalate/homocitrate/citramalate synthase
MVAEVARYVPGFTLRADPQFDRPSPEWSGNARVALFLEVRGNGDYPGNAPTEVLAATFARLGIGTGVNVDGVLAAAEEVVRPIIPRLPWMDRASVVQGYAGVYSSFLLHAQRAAERYGVPAHAILQRVGEAGYVGGQEDMIIDIALQLQEEGTP